MATITGFRANFLLPVGTLGEERLSRVREALKGFMDGGAFANGRVFANPSASTAVFVTEAQITISVDGADISPDLDSLQAVCSGVFSALMLDVSAMQLIVNFTALIRDESDPSASTMQRSLQWISGGIASALSDMLLPAAVGLRFILRGESAQGEIKVEPFLRQANMYYVEMEKLTPSRVNLKAAWEFVRKEYGDFSSSLLTLVSEGVLGRHGAQ